MQRIGKWFSALLSGLMVLLVAGTLMGASAPFDIDETSPADDDIVSQFPSVMRTAMDIIEDYLNTDHDATTGHHGTITLVDNGGDLTVESDEVGLWNDSGRLKYREGTGSVVSFNGVPTGTVVDWAGPSSTTPPTGWLLAYGQCVSRTTYADLFAVVSTTYDNGCSGSDFGIPDLRGRVSAGQDDMGGTSANRLTDAVTGGLNGDTIGDTGGEESHTLTEAELAEHNHTLTDPGHQHDVEYELGNFAPGTGGQRVSSLGEGGPQTGTNAADTATTGITLADTGGDTAHNVVQPTIVLNKIIKY